MVTNTSAKCTLWQLQDQRRPSAVPQASQKRISSVSVLSAGMFQKPKCWSQGVINLMPLNLQARNESVTPA